MTIKRVINGMEVEITLTDRELWEAYLEEQGNCDVADVDNFFEDREDADLMEVYGKTMAEIEPLKAEMVSLYRKYMDNCDHWIFERDEAIDWVLKHSD